MILGTANRAGFGLICAAPLTRGISPYFWHQTRRGSAHKKKAAHEVRHENLRYISVISGE